MFIDFFGDINYCRICKCLYIHMNNALGKTFTFFEIFYLNIFLLMRGKRKIRRGRKEKKRRGRRGEINKKRKKEEKEEEKKKGIEENKKK